MEKKHKLALFIGYFLAKFNAQAYNSLNFGNQTATHIQIGRILNVKPNTVRRMREELDPLFPFNLGQHKRPMSPSRTQVAELFKDYSFENMLDLVNDIINSNGESSIADEISKSVQNNRGTTGELNNTFTTRAITGAKAEEIFKNTFLQIIPSFSGELIDTTLDGIGYDFKNSLGTMYIEVKGSANDQKGILLTDKEWEAAKRLGDKYYLVLIYLINEHRHFILVNNPVNSLSPKLTIQRSITMNWNVSHVQMNELSTTRLESIIELT